MAAVGLLKTTVSKSNSSASNASGSGPGHHHNNHQQHTGSVGGAAAGIQQQQHNQLTRSLERILEDAHLSGELKLSGRKLRDFPKAAGKYNLNDTVIAGEWGGGHRVGGVFFWSLCFGRIAAFAIEMLARSSALTHSSLLCTSRSVRVFINEIRSGCVCGGVVDYRLADALPPEMSFNTMQRLRVVVVRRILCTRARGDRADMQSIRSDKVDTHTHTQKKTVQ